MGPSSVPSLAVTATVTSPVISLNGTLEWKMPGVVAETVCVKLPMVTLTVAMAASGTNAVKKTASASHSSGFRATWPCVGVLHVVPAPHAVPDAGLRRYQKVMWLSSGRLVFLYAAI